MDLSIKNDFTQNPSTIMHIDLNSCFATIEQQANPLLRGKPIAVAAFTTPSGCIVAPSIEAKRYGIKTGMRVKDGKILYPDLIVLPPDPMKYRSIHLKLKALLSNYTDQLVPKSIDEFVLDFEGFPAFNKGLVNTGNEIKDRIKKEVGDWLTVNIGIAPNRFLAKLAAGLHKPDGLDVIDKDNYLKVYSELELVELHYIKQRNAARLNSAGIFTVMDMYNAPLSQLRSAFRSILANWWYMKLRGYEVDDREFARKSYGNGAALKETYITPEDISPVLQKLVEKMSARMRKAGFKAKGVHLGIVYRDGSYWHQGKSLTEIVFDSREIYKIMYRLLWHSPYRKPMREIGVTCFELIKSDQSQLNLFDDVEKKERLSVALDSINENYGHFVISPANMMTTDGIVLDRVAFGGVKELEELVLAQ